MDLGYRIEYQLRRYLKSRQRQRLHDELGIPGPTDLPITLLKIARTIRAYNPRIERLIDIGAHVGLFAKTMNQVWGFSEIICAEANQALSETLRQSLPAHAKILQTAIGGSKGEAVLYVHPDSSMSSIVPVDKNGFDKHWSHYKADDISGLPVGIQTLDSVLAVAADTHSKNIFLKIDTQGAEMEVLSSGRSVLALSSACLIEYMFWPGYKKEYDLGDLIAFMKEADFRCVGAVEPTYREDGRAAYADMLFLPESDFGG